jgi:hypothetical protein
MSCLAKISGSSESASRNEKRLGKKARVSRALEHDQQMDVVSGVVLRIVRATRELAMSDLGVSGCDLETRSGSGTEYMQDL